jgi:endoglucanase Acf2
MSARNLMLGVGLAAMLGGVFCAQAQTALPAGSGQLLLAPRAGDARPPLPFGLSGEAKSLPAPTNQWYSAIVFDREAAAVFVQPLSVRAAASGLEVALPVREVIESVRRDNEIHYPHRNPLVIQSTAFELSQGSVSRVSDFSVDLAMGRGEDRFDLTLMRGSPYVWGQTSRGGLRIRTPLPARRIHAQQDPRALALAVGSQAFAIFAPSGVLWSQVDERTWTATLPEGKRDFSIAALPNASAEAFSLIARHGWTRVEDTQVHWRFDERSSRVHTTYQVKTRALEGGVTDTLLGLYPHHWHDNPLVADRLLTAYDTVRGPLRLLAGQSFETQIVYHGFVPYWPKLSQGAQTDLLRELLQTDARNARRNMLQVGPGPYWQGKGLQRIAKLLDVAQVQGESEISERLMSLLRERVNQWFSGRDAKTYFHLDRSVGTVLAYPEEYFSVRQLNDHHFHYGYWIRTVAEMALREPALASDAQWGPMVGWLIRDIATPQRGGKEFPFLRHFDVYEGHSWASGVALGEMGNNQESSSEAVNAWAGLILWAELTGDRALRDLGVYLYATEIQAIRHYWFDVYDLVFAKEYRNPEVSMLFGSSYMRNTWWTDEPRQSKGINLLPITTSSTYLGRDPHHTRRSLATLKDDSAVHASRFKKANPRDIWQDLFAKTMALTDPAEGMRMWDRWGAVELGDTRSHTLHFLTSLEQMGVPDFTVTADHVLAAVFRRSDGTRTYLAYNAGTQPRSVRFSDGQVLEVGARSLTRATRAAQ